ncbi:LysR family transcriptional regulator (plasmid) [Deinococcus sp. KNUC1210]|uniref:LysR family transcriptional regulator n=1 Tax=Deinococcus sp. KNUC1210 TaxID=2917691 RepID=UPI001EEFE20B|nr:LysR family transcriptional regulator [Deinococcus sp. KNUC1210]ULH14164.1 LysR family transcriptional regulator [Deinococcus sp. KNUC1210]
MSASPPQPTLAQLRAFVTAAQKRTMSAAATELNLTQSAVSHAVRQLEGVLGVQLLERTGRGVTLSAAGERLLPLSEQILSGVETLLRAAPAPAVSGLVRIAAFPSLARHLLPRALAQLSREYPAIALHLDDAHLERAAVIQAVRAGSADIGLTQLLPGMALAAHPLGDDLYELVAPSGWTLPQVWTRPYIHLGELRDQQLPDALARYGVKLRPSLNLSSETAIVAMVASGLGFAVLPSLTIPELPASVSRRPLPWKLARSYGTVTRPGPLTPAVQTVLTVLWQAAEPAD